MKCTSNLPRFSRLGGLGLCTVISLKELVFTVYQVAFFGSVTFDEGGGSENGVMIWRMIFELNRVELRLLGLL